MDNTFSAKSSALRSDASTPIPPPSPAHNQTSLDNTSGGNVSQELHLKDEIWDETQTELFAVTWHDPNSAHVNKTYVEIRSEFLRSTLAECGLAINSRLPSTRDLSGYLPQLKKHEKRLGPFINWLKSVSTLNDPTFWDGEVDEREDPTFQ
ncbi:uncharacterized protein CIMG_08751 [Coccidioides immitis RS]|uniref:Uncharacterized protein n=1 Tax=Coccidioides immitis (strain RS) TaxID=246410 RepID=J3K646_COCIM|nr:uncharacterized protein CIMG_08751 [Coccidioides immitis RS]EAS30005.3 hypothetical protein CIMG_08751 [Coccidioides immitis RS]